MVRSFAIYPSFYLTHRRWMDAAQGTRSLKRGRRWSESIALDDVRFTENEKKALGHKARGPYDSRWRGGFELREARSVYVADFDSENNEIGRE